jgi:flagellar assembly protein FliH
LSPEAGVAERIDTERPTDRAADARGQVLRGSTVADLPIASLVGVSPSVRQTQELVEQARAEGLAQGRAAAEGELGNQVARSVRVLEELADDLHRARNEWIESVPEQALDIALELAELILMREVTTSDDPARDAIRRCLSELRATEGATIHLNPDDLAVLDQADLELQGRPLRFVADADVEPGDALAHLDEGGTIDASVATALARVVEAVRSC